MKNIALGQYYPSDSVLHRMDGRMKLILAILYIAESFICRNVWSFLILCIGTLILVRLSRIPLHVVMRSLRSVIFILIITFVINIFFTEGAGAPLFEFGILKLYSEGLWNAGFMVIRILALIMGTSLFVSYTTTPIRLTDSIESLLSPLKKIKIPVHEFAMMMSISLRFIPTLSEETEKIMTAQRSRGADFNNGSILKKARALVPVLVPLFVSAFRRADELAVAMECRCYHGGNGRTRLNVPHLSLCDFVGLGLMLLFGGILLAADFIPIGYSM